jgi:mRNA interferase RelE/StbE
MEWEIALSRQAKKFLAKNHLPDEFVIAPLRKAISKFFGESESASVDVKRLSGAWTGYYRIRSGRIRIIFSFDAEKQRAFVEIVDYRGDVYK